MSDSTAHSKKIAKTHACDGTYMVVNIIARRAREINKQRANTGFYDDVQPDPLDVAANEFVNDLLDWEFRHHLVGTGEDFRAAD